ncbi:MAG TPA: hypothetical protein P5059_03405, partial [Candidatus Dojkabacteria bacterium]|nr:hypothetical protein [Candidatus Dojkabacteria bacterium]
TEYKDVLYEKVCHNEAWGYEHNEMILRTNGKFYCYLDSSREADKVKLYMLCPKYIGVTVSRADLEKISELIIELTDNDLTEIDFGCHDCGSCRSYVYRNNGKNRVLLYGSSSENNDPKAWEIQDIIYKYTEK